jgi:hypothetical protein
VGTSPRRYSQDDVSQQEGAASLSLPELNLLFEDPFVWDEISVSNADVAVITSQDKVFQQILNHWKSFLDLKLTFPGSGRTEHLRSHNRA